MGKKRFAFILCIIVSCQLSIVNYANAQQTFTDRLQQVVGSAGRIILHQDKNITDLVNNTPKKPEVKPEAKADPKADPKADSKAHAKHIQRKQVVDTTTHLPQVTDSTDVDSLSLGPKVKINGYRIQVYFGDNSRKGKTEAQAAGRRFRNTFPDLSVYVSFASPHWLCRAGDFRTMEEANEKLRQIREMGIFREAVIVKSKINVRL